MEKQIILSDREKKQKKKRYMVAACYVVRYFWIVQLDLDSTRVGM